jgi:hypothetical protein
VRIVPTISRIQWHEAVSSRSRRQGDIVEMPSS